MPKSREPLVTGEDPFPLKPAYNIVSAREGSSALVKRPGRATYIAQQFGPTVALWAIGEAPSFQTIVRLEQLPLTEFPPRFALFFYEPEITSPAQTPFAVPAFFHSEEPVKRLVVQDADGLHEVAVLNVAALATASTGGGHVVGNP